MDQEKEECVSDTQQWMNKAFDVAELALSNGEVPVGCVFVCRNNVIADGANTVNRTKNATRHAEMNCIDMVMRSCKIADVDWRKVFPEVEVFVTVEPCIMCCSALSSLHVKRVTYGCDNFRFGGCGSVLDVPQLTDNPLVTVSGVQKDRAIALLKQFYQGSNPNAPPSKIAKKEARLERRAIREKQVFVTVEPCIMCCSALSSLHVKRVTYGCDNFRFGGCGSVLDVPQLTDNPLVTVSGVQKDRAIALLKQFYQGSNPNAPPSKIAKKEARLERRAIREKQDCEDIHSKAESAMNCPVPDKSNNTGQSNHIVN